VSWTLKPLPSLFSKATPTPTQFAFSSPSRCVVLDDEDVETTGGGDGGVPAHDVISPELRMPFMRRGSGNSSTRRDSGDQDSSIVARGFLTQQQSTAGGLTSRPPAMNISMRLEYLKGFARVADSASTPGGRCPSGRHPSARLGIGFPRGPPRPRHRISVGATSGAAPPLRMEANRDTIKSKAREQKIAS
jgi:hypothetical protein